MAVLILTEPLGCR